MRETKVNRKGEREKERERQRERQRETERDRDRERQKDREIERQIKIKKKKDKRRKCVQTSTRPVQRHQLLSLEVQGSIGTSWWIHKQKRGTKELEKKESNCLK